MKDNPTLHVRDIIFILSLVLAGTLFIRTLIDEQHEQTLINLYRINGQPNSAEYTSDLQIPSPGPHFVSD